MLKFQLLFVFVSLFYNKNCEEVSSFQKNKLCTFITDGKGKSLGEKLTIQIPCSWKSTESKQPHVVKTFFDDALGLLCTIIVAPFDNNISKNDVVQSLSADKIKYLLSGYGGDILKTTSVKINNNDAIEIDLLSKPNGITIYYLIYLIPTNRNLILVRYGAGGDNEKVVKKKYYELKPYFTELMRKTVVKK
jgi:hypothetical protein